MKTDLAANEEKTDTVIAELENKCEEILQKLDHALTKLDMLIETSEMDKEK